MFNTQFKMIVLFKTNALTKNLIMKYVSMQISQKIIFKNTLNTCKDRLLS